MSQTDIIEPLEGEFIQAEREAAQSAQEQQPGFEIDGEFTKTVNDLNAEEEAAAQRQAARENEPEIKKPYTRAEQAIAKHSLLGILETGLMFLYEAKKTTYGMDEETIDTLATECAPLAAKYGAGQRSEKLSAWEEEIRAARALIAVGFGVFVAIKKEKEQASAKASQSQAGA